MAFISEDDKQLDSQGQQQPGQGGMSLGSGGGGTISGTQGAVSTGQVSTAGVGSGGTGGWTNIQAYMNANKGDTGSAQNLKAKVGGQFEQEKTNMQGQANELKTQAQSQAQGVADTTKNAQQYIQGAGQNYSYDGQPNQAYSQNVSKVQGALNSKYSGPRSFNYSLGDQTQKYGAAIKDNGAFDKFMGDIYADKSGGGLSQGGRTLQTQLDVNNEALSGARQDLANDYQGLGTLRDQTVKDTDSALAGYEQEYRTNQGTLKDYLSNAATGLDSKIGKAESQALYDYENAKNGGSGMASAGRGEIGWAADNVFGIQDIYGAGQRARFQIDKLEGQNLWGDDLNYNQLQGEADLYKGEGDYQNSIVQGERQRNQGTLDKFYADQDSKFENTADAEEREWNAIQDMLGSSSDRKKQGFKVRG